MKDNEETIRYDDIEGHETGFAKHPLKRKKKRVRRMKSAEIKTKDEQ